MRTLLIIGLASVLTLSACATNVSPQSYSVGSVGQVNRAVPATVISVREVDVEGSSALGGASGTAAGAVLGSAMGGNNGRANIIGAIGGAVVGGLAGAASEAGLTKQKGLEYVVETENGNLMTIVQGMEPMFEIKQRVMVLYGSPSRIVADPRSQK